MDEQGNLVGVKESGKLNLDERDAREEGDEENVLPPSLKEA
jgi:hypothetical protein